MVVRFQIIAPESKRRTVAVRLPILLGRGTEAKFRIQHDLVSRRHCELFAVDGSVYVRDLGSTNGTYLDANQVAAGGQQPVAPGSTIRVGGLAFIVEYERPAAGGDDSTVPLSATAGGFATREAITSTGGGSEIEAADEPDFVFHEEEPAQAGGPPGGADEESPAGEPDSPSPPGDDVARGDRPDRDDALDAFFKGLE